MAPPAPQNATPGFDTGPSQDSGAAVGPDPADTANAGGVPLHAKPQTNTTRRPRLKLADGDVSFVLLPCNPQISNASHDPLEPKQPAGSVRNRV